jgi:hypothetical protein
MAIRERMKSLFAIPTIVAALLGAAALLLAVAGVRINPAQPLAAGVIASVAGILGLMPIQRNHQGDSVSIVQSALAGTVLHLLVSAILTLILLASHGVEGNVSFITWLLCAYWISLIVLIWQLRRVMTTTIGAAKVRP